ncbi:hypothetical protein Pan153_63460 [Gimesia panareensis]|uniref:Uncharacterized protein n=1 Tax=Gimesia panareensis TaxID=2527978 RepID=A0A518FZB2_9PLAN|nr:hypothetical protein Pan153_63460 [Gimesia panareensis]
MRISCKKTDGNSSGFDCKRKNRVAPNTIRGGRRPQETVRKYVRFHNNRAHLLVRSDLCASPPGEVPTLYPSMGTITHFIISRSGAICRLVRQCRKDLHSGSPHRVTPTVIAMTRILLTIPVTDNFLLAALGPNCIRAHPWFLYFSCLSCISWLIYPFTVDSPTGPSLVCKTSFLYNIYYIKIYS